MTRSDRWSLNFVATRTGSHPNKGAPKIRDPLELQFP